jgi:hypothetical protein
MNAAMFEFLQPSVEQIDDMAVCRKAAAEYAQCLEMLVPEGPDKTHVLRKLREVSMWVNVAITRHADGTPRASAAEDSAELPEDSFERQSGEAAPPAGSRIE